MRVVFLPVLLAASIFAEPRKAVVDYPVHASTPDFDIGVEYTVHSYSGTGSNDDGQMYLAKDYLVFEVAVFPKGTVDLPMGAFELTVNNSKRPIAQANAESVAASVRYPDWSSQRQMQVGAGMGGAGVTLGGPPRVERFPGDPTAQSRLPRPPQAPADSNYPEKERADPARLALLSALKTGPIHGPESGNIYFPYTGNTSRIKQLVLHVATGTGTLDIKVR